MNLEQWNALVVEDEPDGMELVRDLLEYHGIHSMAAYDAKEALAILKKTTPTVIIIDLQLPEIDGWSLLREIQRNPALEGVSCVAITAYHALDVARQALRAGFDAYFPKPLEAATFVPDLVKIVEQ